MEFIDFLVLSVLPKPAWTCRCTACHRFPPWPLPGTASPRHRGSRLNYYSSFWVFSLFFFFFLFWSRFLSMSRNKLERSSPAGAEPRSFLCPLPWRASNHGKIQSPKGLVGFPVGLPQFEAQLQPLLQLKICIFPVPESPKSSKKMPRDGGKH